MKRQILWGAAAVLLLAGSLTGAAQDKGYWRAASSNSEAVTGDLEISGSKVTIDLTAYTIADIRKLTPAEVAAAFDAAAHGVRGGELYRLRVPAAKRFLHRNTLCGSDDTQWMATYVEGHTLQVLFFSGDDMPVFTPDALANSTALCGIYTYVS